MGNEHREVIQLTEESLMALLQGKDLIVSFVDGEEQKTFHFKGPWDGVFLTRDQLMNLEYQAERRAFDMVEKVQKSHIQTVEKCRFQEGK